MTTREYMEGECSNDQSDESSLWNEPSANQIREAKVYDPSNYKTEFRKVLPLSRRQAIGELSKLQRKVIYLRFWCDRKNHEIARDLNIGVNVAEQITEATVSKLKRRIVELETNSTPEEGGPECA